MSYNTLSEKEQCGMTRLWVRASVRGDKVILHFPGLGEDSRKGQCDSGRTDNRGWEGRLDTKSSSLWEREGSSGITGLSMVQTNMAKVNGVKARPVHQPFMGFLSLLVHSLLA